MAGGEPVLCLRCGPLLWWSWAAEAVSVVSVVLSSHREQASRREIRQPDDSFGGRCRVFGALIGQFANARVLGSPNCFGAVASRRFQAPHIHQTEFLACSIAYLDCCVTRDIYFGGQAAETESEPTPTEMRAMQQSSLVKVPPSSSGWLVPSPSRLTSEPPPHPFRTSPDPVPSPGPCSTCDSGPVKPAQAQWGVHEKSGQSHPSVPIQDQHQVQAEEIAHLILFWQK